MNQRTERLRALMATHRLDCYDVAAILHRSVQTVRVWRCKYPARTIPDGTLRLLELTLAARVAA